ncbi:MAG: phosphoribosyltransferase [Proteobacteria bacterium]|nr:phosphoribosyltransferase [Pseudomonadota bacterium]
MSDKVNLDFLEIKNRLNSTKLPQVDLIVGIAEGGKVPASLVAWKLGCSLLMLKINFRDSDNRPRFDSPQLLKKVEIPGTAQKILLVDDVAVSGKTLAVAKKQLDGFEITTLVLKGKGDIVLFPEIPTCVNWPWN